MKISIIGPATQIPPVGWGAVESLIWDYKLSLEKLKHKVQIINISNPYEIIQLVNEFRPDFVHINYDDWIVLYPYIQYPCAITSHFGYIERPDMMNGYVNIFKLFRDYQPNIFCLSENIKKVYKFFAEVPEEKLYINPNGVNSSLFKKTHEPKYPDRSIYLAKIDYRKRQHLFQSIDSLWYAGNIADSRFNTNKNYLGEWDKDTLYGNLTNYGNLVLLSDGEAHSLVLMEALASGLGVVISEFATANLDLDKEFIDVIPENKINDLEYIESIIIKNREYSISHRKEILEYSKNFEWVNIIKNYYLPNIEKLISKL
jgi:glycosyltransferase involved in cell wall biosynthesis